MLGSCNGTIVQRMIGQQKKFLQGNKIPLTASYNVKLWPFYAHELSQQETNGPNLIILALKYYDLYFQLEYYEKILR